MEVVSNKRPKPDIPDPEPNSKRRDAEFSEKYSVSQTDIATTQDTEDPQGDKQINQQRDDQEIQKDREVKQGCKQQDDALEKQNPKDQEKAEKERKKLQEKMEKERKKEEEKAERERKKEEEKAERERKKEEEKRRREEEKEKKKEQDRKRKEEERIERERKKEEERLEKERKKEEERIEREKKKEADKLERERKREEEKKKKEEEKLERKRKLEEEKEEKKRMEERSQMKISSFFVKKPVANTPKETERAPTSSDFDKDFLPFYIKANVTMASLKAGPSEKEIDELLASEPPKDRQFPIEEISNHKTVTSQEILDLFNSATATEEDVKALLAQLPPIKYIRFYENSRPPYIGTWLAPKHTIHLTDPFDTSSTGLDYEYDSDLEWNEDEEGEDLDDEDMEEEDDVEDDDIDDFVEGSSEGPKKIHTLVVNSKVNDGTNDEFFRQFTVETMVKGMCFPIPEPSVEATHQVNSQEKPIDNKPAAVNVLVPQKKTIKDPATLKALAEFVTNNKEYTIATLVELSKKEFASHTKALLKNTIQEIAEYNKKTSKWEVRPSEPTPQT